MLTTFNNWARHTNDQQSDSLVSIDHSYLDFLLGSLVLFLTAESAPTSVLPSSISYPEIQTSLHVLVQRNMQSSRKRQFSNTWYAGSWIQGLLQKLEFAVVCLWSAYGTKGTIHVACVLLAVQPVCTMPALFPNLPQGWNIDSNSTYQSNQIIQTGKIYYWF